MRAASIRERGTVLKKLRIRSVYVDETTYGTTSAHTLFFRWSSCVSTRYHGTRPPPNSSGNVT